MGAFFPSLLEPRRRVDKALWAVIMTARITGTSTRKVDDLVRALGCDTGVSKSTVSRIRVEIDEQVDAIRERRLDHTAFPYVFLDATYVKARVAHHIVSRAVVVATGVTADGNREVLGLEVGDSEDEVFSTAFLRRLKDRGLGGVRLVISDAHAGLKAAAARVLQGPAWQRCKVHLMRNLLAHVPTMLARLHRGRQPRTAATGPLRVLSDRELEVLTLLADGLSNPEIADRLVLSAHTVHRHVANILRKLGLSSRSAAAALAGRHGLGASRPR